MQTNIVDRLVALDFVATNVEIDVDGMPEATRSGIFSKNIEGEYHVITDAEGCLPHLGTLRLFVGIYKSEADYLAMKHPADAGIMGYALQRSASGKPVFKLDGTVVGPVVAELVWLINERLEVDAVELVAKMFAAALREDLTAEDMGLIVNLNRTPSYKGTNTCASLEFVDGNTQMADVVSDITGEEIDFATDPLWAEVAAAAWKRAREAEFDVERI